MIRTGEEPSGLADPARYTGTVCVHISIQGATADGTMADRSDLVGDDEYPAHPEP